MENSHKNLSVPRPEFEAVGITRCGRNRQVAVNRVQGGDIGCAHANVQRCSRAGRRARLLLVVGHSARLPLVPARAALERGEIQIDGGALTRASKQDRSIFLGKKPHKAVLPWIKEFCERELFRESDFCLVGCNNRHLSKMGNTLR